TPKPETVAVRVAVCSIRRATSLPHAALTLTSPKRPDPAMPPKSPRAPPRRIAASSSPAAATARSTKSSTASPPIKTASAFRERFRYEFRHVRLLSGGRKSNASLVIVGRTQNYGGPFKITTEADLFQDRFEILTLSTQSGLRYLSYLPSLWLNKLRGTQGVEF